MARKNLFTRTLTLPDGRRKYIYGKTKEEADRKLQKARYELGQGIDIASDITFGELAERWYQLYKKPGLKSPNSRRTVLYVLNSFLLPSLSERQVRKITTAQIQATLNQMDGLSNSIQQKALQHLRSIFALAIDEGIISKSPITMIIKAHGVPTKEKIPLTDEQAKSLIAAVTGTNAETFIKIALWTGLRRGEILGLQWEDLDLDKNLLHVRHNALLQDGGPTTVSTQLKTASSRRDIPMPDILADYLRGIQPTSHSPFVVAMKNGAPLTKSAFRAMWRIIDIRTAKPDDDKPLGSAPKNHSNIIRTLDFSVHPHLLRHTYITRLFDAGTDLSTVQYLAGHATPDITLRIYIHYLKSKKQVAAAEKINEAFRSDVICTTHVPHN